MLVSTTKLCMHGLVHGLILGVKHYRVPGCKKITNPEDTGRNNETNLLNYYIVIVPEELSISVQSFKLIRLFALGGNHVRRFRYTHTYIHTLIHTKLIKAS